MGPNQRWPGTERAEAHLRGDGRSGRQRTYSDNRSLAGPNPNPVQIATEGALWGSVQSHKFLCDAVVLSDDAGQFNVGQHALCWGHAERLVHKLDTFTDKHRGRLSDAGARPDLGLLCQSQGLPAQARPAPGCRIARTVRPHLPASQTGFVTLDRLLKRLHAPTRAELLMVLDRPERRR